MSKVRLTVFLLLVLGILGGTAGAATADHEPDHDDDASLVQVNDNNVGQVSAQACHNQVPVNVLGIQVPVSEIAASLGLPVLSDDSPAPGSDTSCDQNTGQENQGGQNNEGSGQDQNDPGDDDEGLIDVLDDDDDDDGLLAGRRGSSSRLDAERPTAGRNLGHGAQLGF